MLTTHFFFLFSSRYTSYMNSRRLAWWSTPGRTLPAHLWVCLQGGHRRRTALTLSIPGVPRKPAIDDVCIYPSCSAAMPSSSLAEHHQCARRGRVAASQGGQIYGRGLSATSSGRAGELRQGPTWQPPSKAGAWSSSSDETMHGASAGSFARPCAGQTPGSLPGPGASSSGKAMHCKLRSGHARVGLRRPLPGCDKLMLGGCDQARGVRPWATLRRRRHIHRWACRHGRASTCSCGHGGGVREGAHHSLAWVEAGARRLMWVCPLGTHGLVYWVRPIMEVD
jgi:hypothetical protein